jgi:hypothetical protein
MVRSFIIAAASAAVFALSSTVFAQQPNKFGTADEAKAMLTKTIAAVKADKAKALDMIAKGEGGFLDRDLYPFCANVSDGKVHPFPNPNAKQLFGTDARNIKDSTGKEFGKEQYVQTCRGRCPGQQWAMSGHSGPFQDRPSDVASAKSRQRDVPNSRYFEAALVPRAHR